MSQEFSGKSIKMFIIIYLLGLILNANTQATILPLSRCLGNCAVCQFDQLDVCSGKELAQCMRGYNGTNCQPKQSLAASITLLDSNNHVVPANVWKNGSIFSCSYVNKRLQKKIVNVLGMYNFQQNIATVEVKPNYKNFIFSFNLVRNSWAPISDSLKIVISDQNDNQIKSQFIQFAWRDEIKPESNLLKCKNNQIRLLQKYEIQGEIDLTQATKLSIFFDGQVKAPADWGLTNVKIAFGCSRFLQFDGEDCQKCINGFYPVKQSSSRQIIGCEPCPTSCVSCLQSTVCSSCASGYKLDKGVCSSIYKSISIPAPGSTLKCFDKNLTLSTTGTEQKLQIPLNNLPSHKKSRIGFYLAYVPQTFPNNQFITVKIDGKVNTKVQADLKGPSSTVKQSCTGFGQKGYYSVVKVLTQYFDHSSNKMVISIWAKSGRKIGVNQITFEYEQSAEPPKQQPTPPSNNTIPQLPQTLPATNNTTNGTASQPTGQNASNSSNNTNQTDKSNMLDTDRLSDNNTTPTNSNSNSDNDALPNETNNRSDNTGNRSIDSNSNSTNNNSNTSNQTNNGSAANSAYLRQQIGRLQKMSSQFIFGLKPANNLTISVLYPYPLQQYPYITAHFDALDQTILPSQITQQGQYHELTFNFDQSFIKQNVTLFVSDTNPMQVARRGLQIAQTARIGSIPITRFDVLEPEDWAIVNRYALFFEIIAWIAIISTIILSFFGSSVITQKFSLLLQIVFLHVYVYSEYLPVNFKYTIGGLQRIENLDYFQTSVGNWIQSLLLGNVLQHSPTKFTIFNKDINFTRAVYPCIIISLLYAIWYLILNGVRKLIQPNLVVSDIEEQRTNIDRFKLFVIRIGQRFLNFWYQVWQYMFITFIWAACVQFHNMAYPIGSNRSAVANMVFCFVMLVLFIILPIATFIYLNKRYFRLDYFEYSYWYQNIFFLKLPQQSLPSNHHRVLILIRNMRYVVIVICFAYLGNYPIPCLIILILNHLLSLLYMIITHIQIKSFNAKLNIVEHALLIILAVILLVTYGVSGLISTNKYMIIGHLLTTCCLLLCVTGIIRVGYYIYHKIHDGNIDKELSQFKPAIGTERVV